MRTPYTTKSGLQIGINYHHPLPVIDGCGLTTQTWLLERHAHRQQNRWTRIINSVYRWL